VDGSSACCAFSTTYHSQLENFFVKETYMNKARFLLAAITLSSLSSLAAANAYVGGNYAFIDEEDVELGALVLKAGYQFNDWASVEARYGFGVGDDSYQGIDVELNYLFGGYFRAGLANDSGFYPYAIIGYTKGEAEASGYGMSLKSDDSDFSYGLGLDYSFDETIAGNVEFMRYLATDGVDTDAIAVGLTYKF
jgi:opacity protein-like surface antigen